MSLGIASFVLAALCGRVAGGGVNFRGAAAAINFRETEAKAALVAELSDADHHLGPLEDELRQMYSALPKNANGKLGRQTMRTALHRYFSDKHGLYLQGLSSSAPISMPPMDKGSNISFPDYLQDALNSLGGSEGADLHQLAALAASVLDLIALDVKAHLRLAYQGDDLSTEADLPRDRVNDIFGTWLMDFLWGSNFTTASTQELHRRKRTFAIKYAGYNATKDWFDAIAKHHISDDSSKATSFDQIAKAGVDAVKDFHRLNDDDCKDLRSTLSNMESLKPGRIRLSTFYNMSLHSHWKFTDSVEVMRAQGSLDETNPKVPMVIIPNYALAKQNCLPASNLFSICCKDICEGLLRRFEEIIGAPQAPPQIIADIFERQQQTTIPEALLFRLSEVAKFSGGQVPLHGRLFAQWMHHANPLECPYPLEVRTPAAIDRAVASEASMEAMQKYVDADTCPVNADGKVGCAGESTELPWSMIEHQVEQDIEVLFEPRSQKKRARTSCLCILFMFLTVAYVWYSVTQQTLAKRQKYLLFMALVMLGYLVGLVDIKVLCVSTLGSGVMLSASKHLGKTCDGSTKLPFHAKSVE